MAGKRTATDDLNHDNWDREEEPEEMGTFQRAPANALKNRVIKTAKRRNPIGRDSGDGEKKSAFASFSGFASKPASTDFSFLNNISQSDSKKMEMPKTNGIDKHASSNNIFASSSATNNKLGGNIFGASTAVANNTNANTNNTSGNNKSETTKSDTYFSKLKGLNESVIKWISQKVEENPLISLTPIFKDYEKYLEEIEKLEKVENVNSSKPAVTPSFSFMAVPDSTSEKAAEKTEEKVTATIPQFTFGPPASKPTSSSNSTATPSFGLANSTTTSSFSLGKTTTTNSIAPTFSFGSNSSSTSGSFSSGSGFSFGSTTGSTMVPNPLATKPTPKTNNEENGGGGDEDEDQPPKVEFTPVIEKDHIYTTRCKVFVKKEKEDGFADRGVGNVFLKPVEGSEKVQFIVRADTNLGNLLCNFILSDSIPTKRMGKKDVMLVTIPLPDSKPPPVPILIRVKSPEEADKLLAILEKHKK